MPDPAAKPMHPTAPGALRSVGLTRVEPLSSGSLLLPMEKAQIAERERHARELLADAEGKAADLVAQACAKARAIEEEASRRGEAAGAARFHELCAQANAQLVMVQEKLCERVLAAAIELSRGILRRELQSDPAAFVAMVEDVVRRCGASARVFVMLHPEQVALVEHARAQLSQAVPLAGAIEVRPNPSAALWSIVVETDQGVYIGGIDAQVASAHESATQSMARGSGKGGA